MVVDSDNLVESSGIKRFLWLGGYGPVKAQKEELARIFVCEPKIIVYGINTPLSEIDQLINDRGISYYAGIIIASDNPIDLMHFIGLKSILCMEFVEARTPEEADLRVIRPCGEQILKFVGFKKPVGFYHGNNIVFENLDRLSDD
jgi:hypothetical protein